ncbi:MAG: flagellar basal body-associated protein FliL [Granulosicoccus sp.]
MNIKKILMFGGGALALVGVSVGASLFFTGAFDEPEPALEGAAPDGQPVEPVVIVEHAPPLSDDVFYHNIQPEFVVNFQGKSRVKFLMIEMVVATHDEEILPILADHDPEIRNTLLGLLSEQDSDVLKTAEGKQTLRDDALQRIDKVVGRYYRTERIKEVYITRLVMQ